MLRCLIIILFTSLSCNAQDILDRAIYPKVAVAIKNHESNYEKSILSSKYNNLFGFKSSRVVGKTKSGYSIYVSKDDSKKDYLLFEKRMIDKYKLNTEEKYLNHLGKMYGKDKKWKHKIKRMMK